VKPGSTSGTKSGIGGARLPPDLLRPVRGALHHAPDKRTLPLGIAVSVLPIVLGQDSLERRILCCLIGMCPHIVTKEQSKLLTPASGLANMKVLPSRPRGLPELSLGSLDVVSAEDVTECLKRLAKNSQRLKCSHRYLNIEYRLRGQAWDRGRTNVVDAECGIAECLA